MPKFRYAPMLRSKAGEAIALSILTDAAKNRMMPVVHLVHLPPKTFAKSVGDAWSARPMALDGTFQSDITGNASSFVQMFDQIGKLKVKLIPSTEYNATPISLAAVQKVRGRYAPGVLVKAKPNELHNVSAWIASQGWQQNEIDLVVTLTEIAGYDPDMLEPIVVKAILDNIPKSIAMAVNHAFIIGGLSPSLPPRHHLLPLHPPSPRSPAPPHRRPAAWTRETRAIPLPAVRLRVVKPEPLECGSDFLLAFGR